MGCNSTVVFNKSSDNCEIVSNVSGGCGNGSDPSCTGLSPRRNRGKVIEEIKDYVLSQLGAPVIDVELDEQQLDIAINKTLKMMEYYCPRDFFKYYTFATTPGKSIYAMPPDVGYVRTVSYKTMPDNQFLASDLTGSIPIEYFFPGGAYSTIQGGMIDPIQPIWGNAGSWALYSGYTRLFNRLSSGIGGWEFIGGYGHIKLYPIPLRTSYVSVHYVQKCMDWEDSMFLMFDGALALSQMALGMIRKKYQGSFGPSGGFSLDGESLYQTGKEGYEKFKENLLTHWADMPPITMA